jgi:VIT1/CCC1 family predicted Fe2+/Mn2+ transporter
MTGDLPKKIRDHIFSAQASEITEYHIYNKLAKAIKKEDNARTLKRIANEELRHHDFWAGITRRKAEPNKWKIFKYYWMARIFGITFGLKLMEKGEEQAQSNYEEIAKYIPEAKRIIDDENNHENLLINILNEERLSYVGSIVLGLNDAIVELTGTLAGLTFALQNTKIIGVAGLITGIAASFSMGASEYLSQRTEKTTPSIVKAAIYTAIAYLITVTMLILPFLTLENPYVCLSVTLAVAIFVILLFNLYVSIAKEVNFKRRFTEMAILSLSVAFISFAVGYAIRIIFKIDI